jgi:hypothetical protein
MRIYMSEKDSLLHPEGLFNPGLRFAFTNITDEDFTSYWSGQPIIVKAGQSVELTHHLAVKMTKEMVDKIMQGLAKLDEVTYYKNNPNTAPNLYCSPLGSMMGVPAARKEWEDKICRLMATDEESPEIVLMKAQLREEILAGVNKEQQTTAPVHIPTSLSEFSELGKEEPKEVKPPMRLKKLS